MKNILNEIAERTKERVAEQKKMISAEEMKRLAEEACVSSDKNRYPFRQALSGEGIHLICEVKKASPSKGIIAEHFPYLDIAKQYDLIITGGSDFHGLYNEKPTYLGSNTTDKENIDRILRLANKKDK